MATSRTQVRSIAEARELVAWMRARGNRTGAIAQWVKDFSDWLENQPSTVDTRAARAMLPLWQVRPVYTAAELSPLLPVLYVVAGIRKTPGLSIGPATTKNILLKAGLPMLGQGARFAHPITGQLDQYFIVERLHYWAKLPVDQEDFVRIWKAQFSI